MNRFCGSAMSQRLSEKTRLEFGAEVLWKVVSRMRAWTMKEFVKSASQVEMSIAPACFSMCSQERDLRGQLPSSTEALCNCWQVDLKRLLLLPDLALTSQIFREIALITYGTNCLVCQELSAKLRAFSTSSQLMHYHHSRSSATRPSLSTLSITSPPSSPSSRPS